MAKIWLPEEDECDEELITIPKLPRLIISGSATNINSNQIEQLEKSYEFDVCSIPLSTEIVMNGVKDEFVENIEKFHRRLRRH